MTNQTNPSYLLADTCKLIHEAIGDAVVTEKWWQIRKGEAYISPISSHFYEYYYYAYDIRTLMFAVEELGKMREWVEYGHDIFCYHTFCTYCSQKEILDHLITANFDLSDPVFNERVREVFSN